MFTFKFTLLQMDSFIMSLERTVTGQSKTTNVTEYIFLNFCIIFQQVYFENMLRIVHFV